MRFDVLSLFPELITNYAQASILGIAQERGLYSLHTHNPRDYSADKHKKVDDTCYGGGAGMLLSPQPYFDCLESVIKETEICDASTLAQGYLEHAELRDYEVIVTSPSGRKLDQSLAKELSQKSNLVILCGRYEGFDQRIRNLATMEVSIGDYVLSGGELPALSIMDASLRHLPDVLGDPQSLEEETHSHVNYLQKLQDLQVSKKELQELLDSTSLTKQDLEKICLDEYEQYTRPADFRGQKVPEVLQSGDHKKILLWRLKNAVIRHCEPAG